MSLVLDVDSYQDVAGAEVYFATRLASTAWVAASTSDKEAALCTATRMLDELHWKGQSVIADQPLAFPRTEMYFNIRQGYLKPMSPTPSEIRVMCCELALHLLSSPDVLADTGSVRDLNIGGVALDIIRPPSRVPVAITNLAKSMLKTSTGTLVWVAN